jgi:hypothetical protein
MNPALNVSSGISPGALLLLMVAAFFTVRYVRNRRRARAETPADAGLFARRPGLRVLGIAGVFVCGFAVARVMSSEPVAMTRHVSSADASGAGGRLIAANAVAGENVALVSALQSKGEEDAVEARSGAKFDRLLASAERWTGPERELDEARAALAQAGLMKERAEELSRTVAGGWRVPYSPEHDADSASSSWTRLLGFDHSAATRHSDRTYAVIHFMAAALLMMVWVSWSQNTP